MRLAFYFALRDTVVADSLDQASRIAYGRDKRWGRVVTVKVCSGSLTGQSAVDLPMGALKFMYEIYMK